MAKVIATQGSVLGIDIGSVALSAVQLDPEGRTLHKIYRFHKGNIRDTILNAGDEFDLKHISAIACTSSSTCINKKTVFSCNSQVAIMAAARHYCRNAASVLHIGAEKFMLIRFDADGRYQSARTNTSCAAGTGSFLDQQADRLNLSGIEELCDKALKNKSEIPYIASRCAVFSNTDIIHAQQRGFSVDAICDSLCKGLAENIINTVFNREPPALPLLLTGGVSRNAVVKGYLEKQLKTTFLAHEDSHLFGAIGAGLMLLKEGSDPAPIKIDSLGDIIAQSNFEKQYFHKPLSLNLSRYPDFSSKESFRFTPVVSKHPVEVEVDIYPELTTGF